MKTNQPNLSNQPCPHCGGIPRPKGYRCPCCNGFGLVGEVGLRRANHFKALEEKELKAKREGTYTPPDFDTSDCYF
jgi:hypothetical protein